MGWSGGAEELSFDEACSPMLKFGARIFLHWWGPDTGVGLRKLQTQVLGVVH